MGKYRMEIELLSDLCVSDGGVYNSSLDTDICYDQLGFPYIPAKRLRGCLRECALELNDWGCQIPIDRMFGFSGKEENRGKVRISNAYIKNYADYVENIREQRNEIVFHAQNILNHFSYIRTQTSVDYETGVAQSTSLRTMRVANKGLVFEAEVDMASIYKDDLKKCCAALRHMGIARTRGLGEVLVTLADKQSEELPAVTYHAGDNYLKYSFTLLEPVICKSVAGGESVTQDYIDGGKMFGLFASRLKAANVDVASVFPQGEFIASNAYLAKNNERTHEVPATYYVEKDSEGSYIDKAYENSENRKLIENKQMGQMKHCYVLKDERGVLHDYSVGIEERYHHCRPDDKSIGRAKDGMDQSKFYQMSSIEAGQQFAGFFYGTEEQIEKLAACYKEMEEAYIGYGRSSEYGKIRFDQIVCGKKAQAGKVTGRILQVKLEAPAICYSDKAMYSTKLDDLKKEILAVLNLSEDNCEKCSFFVNYITVGGFNVTWGYRKPVIECFDKGSVVIIELKENMELPLEEGIFIGERIQEGYGECSITFLSEKEDRYQGEIYVNNTGSDPQTVDVRKSAFAMAICDDLFDAYLRKVAVDEARKVELSDNTKATVSNMIAMLKEPVIKSYVDLKNVVIERFSKNSGTKSEKLEIAKDIIKRAQEITRSIPGEFEIIYNIQSYGAYLDEKEEWKLAYMKAFLTEIKYRLRPKKNQEEKED